MTRILAPLSTLFGGLALVVGLLVAGAMAWTWKEQRDWIVSRAVDRGACATTDHLYLRAATPDAARELFAADTACRAQVIAMLRPAPDFTCRGGTGLTVCTHPLNAGDSTTYVRAIISRSHVLLETIPT